ncbi:MAG: hypothetical protein HOH33_14465 [Verrucomicrobia bacterium]|jgi:sugar/nucleoside kinase (ribokinase family)|nr:hypothetical protein [Verrucomicrobiota bacterium]
MSNQKEIRLSVAAKLRDRKDEIQQSTAFVGLDGFVDEIIHVVDKRMDVARFERIPTIQGFSDRIEEAAGRSTNLELVTQRIKLGGNGPIMANALAKAGIQVTYLGALGYPEPHPVFKPLLDKATKVYSIANPGHTDAYEFQDGKLLMGKLTPLNDMRWQNIVERMGKDTFTEHLNQSSLVAFVNWTMMPYMSEIWKMVQSEVLDHQPRPELSDRKTLFFDLCDPQKRPNEDILEALNLIAAFQPYFSVTLGLNEKEAHEIGEVLGLQAASDSKEGLVDLVEQLHKHIKADTLVVHPVKYAVASNHSEVVSMDGPFIPNPVITTGAGDHFNAGFCVGRLLNLNHQESLATGVATSGFYVHSGKSPTVSDLADILENWPE